MTRILLVDDHDLVRAGLASILQANPGYQVISQQGSGESALDFLQHAETLPELVLMDVNMPGIGGIEATRRIKRGFPDIHILAVTALQDEPFPAKLIKAGATGYITKGCPAQEMFDAIDAVMKGKQYIAGELTEKMTLDKIAGNKTTSPFASLSDREMQVMLMITQGHGNQYISDTLFLSPKTISTYRHRIFEKLNVLNDVELTHMAIRHGVVEQ
jgi:two-component system invasion response regulator UvrY